MVIVFATEFFSEGMGYSENCLPKAMASLGHEVHVVASDLQVYGNLPDYEQIYGKYLGPAVVPTGTKDIDGYSLHRLPHRIIAGYVDIKGFLPKLHELKPDVVQVHHCASAIALKSAFGKSILGYRLYSECHQHLSVTRPFLRFGKKLQMKRVLYGVSRTAPGFLISLVSTKCFPISHDCAFVAHQYYGVQKDKIRIMPLGSDTDLFCPVSNNELEQERDLLRKTLEVSENEILCIYTGRFSQDKNPLLLANAIGELNKSGSCFKGLFIGDGVQASAIESLPGTRAIPFVPFRMLPKYYRAADIGVWPTQESLSMLDAASCGIPVVVSDRMGDQDRVEGNGAVYREGDVADLATVLHKLTPEQLRRELGRVGRAKVVEKYSWIRVARDHIQEYDCSSEAPVV